LIARRVSLITGLYLFVFLFAHLVNLSFGLNSVEAMDNARSWLVAPWANPAGGLLLMASLLIHMILGMRALYRRNTLRLSWFDACQLLLGLSIPLLLLPHMLSMAMLPALTEQHATYEQVLGFFWIENLWSGLRQVVGLIVVWLHACMGLFIWMRLQNWWRKVSLFIYPTVVILPILALLGFVEAGKEVIANAESPASVHQLSGQSNSSGGQDETTNAGSNKPARNVPPETLAERQQTGPSDKLSATGDTAASKTMQTIGRTVQLAFIGYLLLLALVLLLRGFRLLRARSQTKVRYSNSGEFTASGEVTLLEVSRLNNIAQASLCGGKGRCGTCQIAVLAGMENLTPATRTERRKLQQINAADHIRLACQARVKGGSIQVEPVLPGYVVADDMPHRRAAREQESATAPISMANTDDPLDAPGSQS